MGEVDELIDERAVLADDRAEWSRGHWDHADDAADVADPDDWADETDENEPAGLDETL